MVVGGGGGTGGWDPGKFNHSLVFNLDVVSLIPIRLFHRIFQPILLLIKLLHLELRPILHLGTGGTPDLNRGIFAPIILLLNTVRRQVNRPVSAALLLNIVEIVVVVLTGAQAENVLRDFAFTLDFADVFSAEKCRS